MTPVGTIVNEIVLLKVRIKEKFVLVLVQLREKSH